MRNLARNVAAVAATFCEEMVLLLTRQPKGRRVVIDGVLVNVNGPLTAEDEAAWRATIAAARRQSPGGTA